MERRVVFKNKEARKLFFSKLKELKGATSWAKFYKLISIPKSTCQRYRYGRAAIPKTFFDWAYNQLSPKERDYFKNKILIKPSTWGAVLGGKTTAKNHPAILQNGRVKGLQKLKALMNNKYSRNFDLNLPLSKDLCEFIGAFIGDGFTNRYGSVYQTEITGDGKLDKKYLLFLAAKVSTLLNGITPHLYKKNIKGH